MNGPAQSQERFFEGKPLRTALEHMAAMETSPLGEVVEFNGFIEDHDSLSPAAAGENPPLEEVHDIWCLLEAEPLQKIVTVALQDVTSEASERSSIPILSIIDSSTGPEGARVSIHTSMGDPLLKELVKVAAQNMQLGLQPEEVVEKVESQAVLYGIETERLLD